MKDYIVPDFYTLKDRDRFITLLETVIQILFSSKKGFETLIQGNFSYATAEYILSVARKENIHLTSPEDTVKFLESLKDFISSVPVVTLTTSVAPSLLLLKKLQRWFFQELSCQVILDIYKNPQILAGVIIEWEGKYGDYSIRKILENRI